VIKLLENGLKVAFIDQNKKHAVLDLSFGFGSAFEKKKHAGIAHFIEHLIFTGTKNLNRLQISKELEKFGAKVNAYTSRETTNFYIEVPAKYFEKPLKILSDCFLQPKFNEKEINVERKIILNELRESFDNPQKFLAIKFYENMFKNSFGRPIIGYSETIKKIKKRDFQHYFKNFYCANNSVCVVLGNVNKKNILEKLERIKHGRQKIELEQLNNTFNATTIEIERKVEQTHLLLGFMAPNALNKDFFSMQLINAILGSGLSSRLKKEIREKRGLAYQIESIYDYGKNYGLFMVYAACKPKNKKEVIQRIKKEFNDLIAKNVLKQELMSAKIKLESDLILDNSTPLDKAEWIIESLRFHFGSENDFLNKIKKISSKEIKSTAKNFFNQEPLIVSLEPKS